jgi:hypothetical protein
MLILSGKAAEVLTALKQIDWAVNRMLGYGFNKNTPTEQYFERLWLMDMQLRAH